MRDLDIVGWALLSVAIFCWLIARRASAEIKKVKVLAARQIRYANEAAAREIRCANDEAARARIRAAQLKLEMDAWRAGHAQGRSDVIDALPLLAVRHELAIDEPTTCGCRPAAQIGNGA